MVPARIKVECFYRAEFFTVEAYWKRLIGILQFKTVCCVVSLLQPFNWWSNFSSAKLGVSYFMRRATLFPRRSTVRASFNNKLFDARICLDLTLLSCRC